MCVNEKMYRARRKCQLWWQMVVQRVYVLIDENKNLFSLVILDVMMPDIDGFQVLEKIRETSNIPVLMLTAKSGEDDKVFGLRLGADDYLTKPFSIKETYGSCQFTYSTLHDFKSYICRRRLYNFKRHEN